MSIVSANLTLYCLMHERIASRKQLVSRLPSRSWTRLELLRACRIKLRYLNAELMWEDFPRLRSLSREKLADYVRHELARVSRFVNRNTHIEHSRVAVDSKDAWDGIVLKGYGRAAIAWDPSYAVLVDLKGTGPTYVRSDEAGRVSVEPPARLPGRFELNLHGCFPLASAVYEAVMGELLQSQLSERGGNYGANRTYFICELDGKIFRRKGRDRRRYGTERAAIVGRQANLRLHHLDTVSMTAMRRAFLYTNAKLYWRGLFHGSMNRYNASAGPRYADLETVSGIPSDYYRLTAQVGIGFGVWGLSHFYGLFGEWSAGQVNEPTKAARSPFMQRSWSHLLANIGVLLGLGESEVWRLSQLEASLGTIDLHEHLLAINAHREPVHCLDKAGDTFTQLHWIVLDAPEDQVPEGLVECAHVFDLYEALITALEGSRPVSVDEYEQLIVRAAHDGDRGAVIALAKAWKKLEIEVREFLSSCRPDFDNARNWLGCRNRSLVLHRRNLIQDSQVMVDRLGGFPSEFPIRSYLRKFEYALDESRRNSVGKGTSEGMEWDVSGMLVGLQQKARVDRDGIRTMTSTQGDIVEIPEEGFAESWVKRYIDPTIGFLWHDTRQLGALERWGHAFVRIGDWLLDAKLHGLDQHSFTAFISHHRRGAPLYEATFSVSPESHRALRRYFQARLERRATVAGIVCEPRFSFVGSGYAQLDGALEENCTVFALSFVLPEWRNEFPELNRVVQETGLHSGLLTAARLGLDVFADKRARPLALTCWGADQDCEAGFPLQVSVPETGSEQAPTLAARVGGAR